MAKTTLEEGLDRSANKRGFSGTKRHQYIGGAIRNMEKRGEISVKKRPAKSKASPPPRAKTASHATRKPSAPPKPKRPAVQIVLTAKKNAAASKGKPYDVYSIYKGSELWSSRQFRKLSAAKAEAKIEQDAHNQGYRRGMFR